MDSWEPGKRELCPHGVKCYRKNPKHLAEFAHPSDEDYIDCCRHAGKQPEFVSLRKLFEWCDENDTGKAGRAEIAKVWATVQRHGESVGALDDVWEELDEDGNGRINFSELAEFSRVHKVDLPLGIDDLLKTEGKDGDGPLKCGVLDCECENFRFARMRCRYGESCYNEAPDHRDRFCHPDDDDWKVNSRGRDKDMCYCGHKKKLHLSGHIAAGAVDYPKYWEGPSSPTDDSDFKKLLPVQDDMVTKFQELLDATYKDVTTRDRCRHTGSWMVPRGYKMVKAFRNESSKLWRKYTVRKAELIKEKEAASAAKRKMSSAAGTAVSAAKSLKEMTKSSSHGRTHADTETFDFSSSVAGISPDRYRIAEVHIWSSSHVNGIQLVYNVDGADIVQAPHYGDHDDPKKSSFRLDPDEKIESVSGEYANIIDTLTFKTSKKTITFGSPSDGDGAFTLEVPEGEHLAGFFGGTGGHLHNIGIVTQALPPAPAGGSEPGASASADYPPYSAKTTSIWEAADADRLEESVNEWYLFHGSSASAAESICTTDFKMRLAGTATGTLYGKGSYFAESITKADEYSKEEDGCYTVLLCRVLGGNVLYCDDRSPDPDDLTAKCLEGPYDCILGDREKVSGTYKEFIIFDTENVYPEYILKYTRGELFESPSFPGKK